jgi:Organic solute transporter Ostalpha
LFSLDAAFAIDAVRDIYEVNILWNCGGLVNDTDTLQAFVIYAFFNLLINYLGGERSLLILLYGRPPKHHVFPVSLFKSELDASDPFTFLFLKRGILR